MVKSVLAGMTVIVMNIVIKIVATMQIVVVMISKKIKKVIKNNF